jgi:hypothetical protein
MGKFLGFRELRPDETIFGGKGFLTPFRPGKPLDKSKHPQHDQTKRSQTTNENSP